MNTPKIKTCRLTLGLVVIASSFLTSLNAQEHESQDIYELSQFVVNTEADYGYRVTNSITATGIGTAIKNVPVSISVITDDFMNDYQGNELRDIVGIVSGVDPDAKEEWDIRVRGFSAPVQVNGFTRADGFQLDNAARVEVIKGPSSVFHGLIKPGGVINIIPQKPEFFFQNTLTAKYGSYDYKRATFSSMGPIVENKLAYRVYAGLTDTSGWQEFTGKEEQYYAVSLRWIPTRKVDFWIQYDKLDRQDQTGNFLTTSHEGFAESGADPSVSLQSWVADNFGPDEPSSTIIVQDVMYPRGYRSNAQGPDNMDEFLNDNFIAEMKVAANDWLDFRVAANYFERQRLYVRLSNGFRARAGNILNDGAQWSKDQSDVFNFKAEGAARFSLLKMNHKILFGMEYREETTRSATASAPRVVWNPRTDEPRRILQELSDAVDGNFPGLIGRGAFRTTNYYVADQISLFDETLRLLVGARYTDSIDNGDVEAKKTTPQFGALYSLTEAISVFANYSESFEPNTQVDVFGTVVPPTKGEGSEFGFKLDLMEGKVSGTVSYFMAERNGMPFRDFVREAALDLRPIFIPGGAERTKGIELDLVLTPNPNYQVILSYSNFSERETVASDDPRQVGIPMWNVADQRFNFWNKYTWTEGPLEGLFIGGGVQYVGDLHMHPSWRVDIYVGDYWRVDALVGYRFEINDKPATISANIRNLLDEFYLENMQSGEPLSAFIELKYEF